MPLVVGGGVPAGFVPPGLVVFGVLGLVGELGAVAPVPGVDCVLG